MHWQVLYVAHPLIFLHLITLKMDSFVVQGGRRIQRDLVQTGKVPNYVVNLESGCDIYSQCPKNLAFMRLAANAFPAAQANFRLIAAAQSDEIAAADDLWWSLEESLQQLGLFNAGALSKNETS